MIAIQSNKNRAHTVQIIFYLMMGLNIISAYSNFIQHSLLSNGLEGVAITAEMADTNDSRQRIIGIITIILVLATIITFIMWLHRAYKNLHQLKINTLQFTPGWAIGGWFVPFLNFVRPFQIVSEVWNETQAYVLPEEQKRTIAPKTLVGLWWGFWIADNLFANLAGRIMLSADSVKDFIVATKLNILSDGIGMIAMILTLIMVNKIKVFEDVLWEYVHRPPAETKNELPAI